MALSYDFDIHWIIPEAVVADPAIAKMMGDIGFEMNARSNYVALFRDPRTVEALRGAAPEIRAWMESAGFGFNTFDSGVGPGLYPAKDEAARNDVIQRLSENLDPEALRGKSMNGFDFNAFLEAVMSAKPVEEKVSESDIELALSTLETNPPVVPSVAHSDIDAAFANPKAGAPLAAPSTQKTLDDILAGPAMERSLAGDDLKYRPTTQVAPEIKPKKSGLLTLPILIVGGIVAYFVVAYGFGDVGTSIVSF